MPHPTRLSRVIASSIASIAGTFVSSCARTPAPGLPAPSAAVSPVGASLQLVVVTTADWDSTTGVLRRFERPSIQDPWRAVGASTPIVVGRTGLAWGSGFDADGAASSAPHKREGDGRAPAGAFPLDTIFGFASAPTVGPLGLPYVPLTPETDCVDDTASVHYNTVVARDRVPAVDWTSAEHMRTISQYRIGVIVGYNAAPPVRGRGSCIFLHIWAGPRSTTAGCTAMDAQVLEQIVAWLDGRKRPMLVQLPAEEYGRVRRAWSLP